MKKTMLLAAALAVTAGGLEAQEAPATLTLEEAVALARENNPGYRSQLNDEAVADWGVRSAYAAFLPTVSMSGGLGYTAGGEPRVGNLTSEDFGVGSTPARYQSNYSVDVSLGLSGGKVYQIGQERAARRATIAGIDAAALTLESQVTRQYLAALRARDAVELARAELERAEANLSLAEARYEVASGTALEAKQAQVERGRAEVGLLRAEATLDNEKVRLLQGIGLDLDRDVELTSEVRVFEPTWDLGSLLETAGAAQPALTAARATVESAESGVGIARSAYWPSLSLSTGRSGFASRASSDEFLVDRARDQAQSAVEQCEFTNDLLSRLTPPLPPQDCTQLQFTDEMRARVIDENSQFPFAFDTDPMSVSIGVSLPVFQGLSRQQRLEAARASAEDARLDLRARELQIRADVETSYRNLVAAYEAVQLEERNLELARDQLRLARERYAVGTAAFLELMEAEALMARADREYLLGVYTFQEALTALEAAIGQDLDIPEN
jgi:outer membrane protein